MGDKLFPQGCGHTPPGGAYVAAAMVTVSHHEAEVRGKFAVDTVMMMQAVDPEGVGSRQHHERTCGSLSDCIEPVTNNRALE